MDTNAKIRKSIWTTLVCTGLATGGAAWATDCDVQSGDAKAATSGQSQANGSQDVTDAKPVSRLDPKLYSYLHDPKIHQSDGLGQNFGDFSKAID